MAEKEEVITIEEDTTTNKNILRFILINLALLLSGLAAGLIYIATQSQTEQGSGEASGEVSSGSGI